MPHQELERKLASLQAWVVGGLAFMIVFALSSVLGALIVNGRAQDASDRALACYVLPQINRAEQTLPTLAYYREHPDELADQLRILHEQRDLAIDTWGTCDRFREEP